MALDFFEFEKQDKSSWLKAAEKALKGKPYDSLVWNVDNHIAIEPYYTREEVYPSGTIYHPREDNNWLIGESFNGEEASNVNDRLLNALAGGLDSPLLFDVASFHDCLENVSIDFIFPIFRGGQLAPYLEWLKDENFNTSELKGAFIVFEAGYGAIDITESLHQLKSISTALPGYYHSQLSFAIDPDNLGASIGRHLIQLSDLIFQLASNDIPVKIICEIETDSNFIKSVATIRALRLMVMQICASYQIHSNSVMIDAHVNQTAQDIQLGMIGASSQAMAAVTAGVDRLTINCESMNVQQDETVTRRMTRNVHHLMKMESSLDKVVDPLAGSYTVEKLTQEIANQSWEVLQKG